MSELLAEVGRRLGDPTNRWWEVQSSLHWAGVVEDQLSTKLRTIHDHRFSPVRYRDMFRSIYWSLKQKPKLEGSVFVDIGCGTWNPWCLSVLLLLLGARKCYAFDLEPVIDAARAARGVVDLIRTMLLMPQSITEHYPVTIEVMLSRLGGFDMPKLGAGDAGGIPDGRLQYGARDASCLPVGDGEADLLVSNAFLEHVDDVEAVVAETARAVKKGGLCVHGIDSTDHRRYEDSSHDALDYLCMEGVRRHYLLVDDAPHAVGHWMNRLRPCEFAAIFQRHGFEVLDVIPWLQLPVDEHRRSQFVEPYRSMSLSNLSLVSGQFLLRRV